MKIKMREHFREANIHFAPEQVIEVDDALGAWLVEHRKAVRVEEARHLDVEPQFEQAEEPPQAFRNPKRARGAK